MSGRLDLARAINAARKHLGGTVIDTPNERDPRVGPCAVCSHPTHRYGTGGNPLCVDCQ